MMAGKVKSKITKSKTDKLRKCGSSLKDDLDGLKDMLSTSAIPRDVEKRIKTFIAKVSAEQDHVRNLLRNKAATKELNMLAVSLRTNNYDTKMNGLAKFVFSEQWVRIDKLIGQLQSCKSAMRTATEFATLKEFGSDTGDLQTSQIVKVINKTLGNDDDGDEGDDSMDALSIQLARMAAS